MTNNNTALRTTGKATYQGTIKGTYKEEPLQKNVKVKVNFNTKSITCNFWVKVKPYGRVNIKITAEYDANGKVDGTFVAKVLYIEKASGTITGNIDEKEISGSFESEDADLEGTFVALPELSRA